MFCQMRQFMHTFLASILVQIKVVGLVLILHTKRQLVLKDLRAKNFMVRWH